jgi:hypothetical protein
MDAAHDIEELFRRRYDREAIYLPSGRLALYLAFREWLRPGTRVLMSPVTDDVVLFIVLAAGLVPVIGPLDPSTGNLDPSGVEERTWAALGAVLTTNLYGIPDQMEELERRCQRHGLLLVEDACHALDSRLEGRRVGTFGPVAAFSMSKHLEQAGGVLLFAEARRRDGLERRLREELRERTLLQAFAGWARDSVVGENDRVRRLLRSLRGWLSPQRPERIGGDRMPCDARKLERAIRAGGGLDRLDRWTRVDHHDYRATPTVRATTATLAELRAFEQNRQRRLTGTARLLSLGLTPRSLPISFDQALFRVPLFVEQRETVRARLARAGMDIHYVYDPPLDAYAPPELCERIPSPPGAERWSRNVLPVNPLRAEELLAIAESMPDLLRAAGDGRAAA